MLMIFFNDVYDLIFFFTIYFHISNLFKGKTDMLPWGNMDLEGCLVDRQF